MWYNVNMSEKKVDNQKKTKTKKTTTAKAADKKAAKAEVRRSETKAEKAPKVKKKTGKIITIIIAVIIVLAGAGAAVWFCMAASKMDEVPTEDEEIQELLSAYFYGNRGCYDAKNAILTDGDVTMDKLDYTVKENTLMSFLAYYKFTGMTYDEMNEAYHNFFGNGSDLRKKSTYQVTEGTFTIDIESGTYTLDSDCAPPEIATCTIIDRAYKSENGAKIVLRVFTRDIYNSTFHKGLAIAEDNAFEFSGTDELDAVDLPKWEALFRYDKTLERYIITETKALK